MSVIVNRSGTVTVRPIRPRIVTLDNRQVAHLRDMRNRVQPQESPVNAVVRPETQKVVISPVGTKGKDGSSGGSIAPIPFAHGDAPHPIFTAPAAGTLTYCRIIMRTPFNASPAQITIGTNASPEAVMPAAYSDPTLAAEFENTPDLHLAQGEQVNIAITAAAGTTQGDGQIIIIFLPD